MYAYIYMSTNICSYVRFNPYMRWLNSNSCWWVPSFTSFCCLNLTFSWSNPSNKSWQDGPPSGLRASPHCLERSICPLYICIRVYAYMPTHTYITLHHIALQYNTNINITSLHFTIQCDTIQYNTIQYNTIQVHTYIHACMHAYIHAYITSHHITLHTYITSHYTTLHYITLHLHLHYICIYITLHYIHTLITYIHTLHYITSHHIALHLHLHYINYIHTCNYIHYITLRYVTLH